MFAIRPDHSWRKVEPTWELAPDEELHEELPEATLLAIAKSDAQRRIETSYLAAQFSGFDSSSLGAPHHYGSETDDQTKLGNALLLAMASGQPVPFACTGENGVRTLVAHTQAQLAQVMSDGGTALYTLMATRDALLAAVETAITVEDVNAVTWPSA